MLLRVDWSTRYLGYVTARWGPRARVAVQWRRPVCIVLRREHEATVLRVYACPWRVTRLLP